ncbi:MAG: protein kinase [Planctomycetota bacterium]|nr:protein kinase [Planctomycetota bacterium]
MNSESSSGSLPQVGQFLDGYQIVALLGMGGMGAVYKVERQGAIYALKVVLDPVENDLERFEREAVTLAAVTHPNIVRIHTIQWQRGWPYILFEFIEGKDLSSKIVDGQPWSLEESLRVLEPLASALDEIHSRRIIHRDLKPANILIRSSDNKPLLTDFGIAKNQDLDTLTQQGEIVGTISYMAPEQLAGEGICAQTDLWAFAVILYQLLSGGELPFLGSSLMHLAQEIINRDARPITEHGPKLPESLSVLFLKAFAKDPEKRYSSAKAFIDDCQRVARGEALVQRRSGKRILLLALPIIFILTLILAGLVYQQGREWEESREGEARILAGKLEGLSSALPVHYLEHGLNSGEAKSCCADFAVVEQLATDLERRVTEEKGPWLFWVDSKKIQRMQGSLGPSLASLAFIHTKDLKDLSENAKVKYKDRGLLNAFSLYRNGQFERAFEAYDRLAGLSRDWTVTVRVMKASCAVQLGQFKEAAELLDGLESQPEGLPVIRQLQERAFIHLSVEELFKPAGNIDRSSAYLKQLIKMETPLKSLFKAWNSVFQQRFQKFKPKSAFQLEMATIRHRELSYDFLLIEELTLSEETLRLCLKSAQKRLDHGTALIYCRRVKKLNPAFPIPKAFQYAFVENGELDYAELCVDLHRRIGLERGRLLNHFKMVFEAGKQGVYLEGFDDLFRREFLARDRAVVDFLNRKSSDPFQRFWRSFIRVVDGTEQDLSQFEDFTFVVDHKRAPGVLKAIALTEHVRKLCIRHTIRNEGLSKAKLKRCFELLDKAAKLPHSRPNVIDVLRFSLMLNSCESSADAHRLSKSMMECLTRTEAVLKLRLTLTVGRALYTGRPNGQPYGRLVGERYKARMNNCSLSWGQLYYKLEDYRKALDRFLPLLKRSSAPAALAEILVCMKNLPSFRDFDSVVASINSQLARAGLDGAMKSSLKSFKRRVLALKKSRG